MQPGDYLRHTLYPFARAGNLERQVLVSPNEECGLHDLPSTIGGKQFPVPVDIAVPIEATAKTCLLECFNFLNTAPTYTRTRLMWLSNPAFYHFAR